MSNRSVAKADVAELTAALDSAVDQEKEHHLVIVSTNKVLSTTQFKQMFYSRGDDFFQIANVYECPDSCSSVHSSVWGIDCKDPHSTADNAPGLVTMDGNRLTGAALEGTGAGYNNAGTNGDQTCFNFNKLGGRENDPAGCAWAYSYAHDGDRNFYAQHEVMGYLEKDTCVKRDFWTACSRMSIEDQLYGLAFASETDQDLCMAVTCARRWSEVEDALAESCAAADEEIKRVSWEHVIKDAVFNLTNARVIIRGSHGGLVFDSGEIATSLTGGHWGGSPDLLNKCNLNQGTAAATEDAPYLAPGFTVTAINGSTAASISFQVAFLGAATSSQGGLLSVTGGTMTSAGTIANLTEHHLDDGGNVDLYINVRVSNGHPKALDTILRVRFTVAYVGHEPSALNTWNTRASEAAKGVIKTGVVGDAPEGGKEQHEDTTVVVA